MHDLDAAVAGRPVPPSALPAPEPEACNYCDTPIMWLTTSNGRRMPVDRDPSPNGNLLIKGQHVGVLGKTQAVAARKLGEQLHTHHVTSCPQASSWNRGARDDARRAGRSR